MPCLTARQLADAIAADEPLLTDGGIGTELMRRGVSAAEVVTANTTNADMVLRLHGAYLQAGADVLTANTFAASWKPAIGDAIAGLEIARLAASEAARPIGFWVSLSTGQCQQLPPAIVPSDVVALVETVTTIGAARDAVAALKETACTIVGVSFSPADSGDLADGTTIEQATEAVAKLGVAFVGLNCGWNPYSLCALVPRARAAGLPVICQPGGGLPHRGADGAHWPLSPTEFANLCRLAFRNGAAAFGGCCGTGPAHIEEAHAAMRH